MRATSGQPSTKIENYFQLTHPKSYLVGSLDNIQT